MALKQTVLIDEVRRSFIIQTNVPEIEIRGAYNQREFLQEVHHQIASKIAEEVYKQVAPAIDEAMKNLKLAGDGNGQSSQ